MGVNDIIGDLPGREMRPGFTLLDWGRACANASFMLCGGFSFPRPSRARPRGEGAGVNEWLGISQPFWFVESEWFYTLWRRVMCQRGYHLFDEIQRLDEHTLFCDACQLEIGIGWVEQPGEGEGAIGE